LQKLAEAGNYTLTDRDRSQVADFDHLLCQKQLIGPPDDDEEAAKDFHRNSGPWAWTETLFNAAHERRLKRYAPELERALSELSANQAEEGSEEA
jgi:hypothetical protein